MNYRLCLMFGLLMDGYILSKSESQEKEPFSLDAFLSGNFKQRSFSGLWISDNQLQYQDPVTQDLIIYDVKIDMKLVFLKHDILAAVRGEDPKVSADRKFVLIAYDRQPVFRHSATARFFVYSMETRNYFPVARSSRIQIAEWGPVGSSLVYVMGNNMYYVPAVNSQMNDYQLTAEGVPGLTYMGVPDWIYEEEVFDSAKAFWFSPRGDRLMYMKFDDKHVPESTHIYYGTVGNIKNQYPQEIKMRYTKPGAENPKFSAWFIDLYRTEQELSFSKAQTYPSKSLPLNDDLFYGASWVFNDQIVLLTTNRVQNESICRLCTVTSPTNCRTIFEELNTSGWVNKFLPLFSREGDRWLTISARKYSAAGKFDHLYLTYSNSNSVALTAGDFTVTKIIAWDQARRIVYYSATEENFPSRTQVYGVHESHPESFCLSCGVKSPEGRFCQSASAKFSMDFTYLILRCTGPDPLVVSLYKNMYPLGHPVIVLQDNKELRLKLQRKLLPQKLDFRVAVPGPFQSEVRLLLPPDADLSGRIKYPLVIKVYAGPDSKQVTNDFRIGFSSYLTTSHDIIYGYIDGRGSGLKGKDMLFAGYRRLGTVEIEDQIGVTKYLQKTLPYVDSNRTGIWGWSYGGYATARVLETDTNDVFKCGISVAPVSSWIYYDSIYTERYMGLPTKEDNLAGYTKSDLFSNVTALKNLKNKHYYLIHGTADDNVHYQQSMMFSKALELNDVLFNQQSYPDENHGIGRLGRHLYHSMSQFWKNCFGIEE